MEQYGIEYYRKKLEEARESSPVAKQIELVRCPLLCGNLRNCLGCSEDISWSCLVRFIGRSETIGECFVGLLDAQSQCRLLSEHELRRSHAAHCDGQE